MPIKPKQPALRELAPNPVVRRTIHYLGSKLRLVAPIRRAIASVAPEGEPICDLFSGSGIVSLALSPDWQVTSVDIQEYSRVLCSGLVAPTPDASSMGERLCRRAFTGSLRRSLRQSLAELLTHERQRMTDASEGDVGGLCDLLEHGSLLALDRRDDIPPILRYAANAALDELNHRGLASGPPTVVTRHFGGRYFSWEQAIDFDALLAEIHHLMAASATSTSLLYSLQQVTS